MGQALASQPCALRLVTCVVLMLSDIDVFFSVLFLSTLNETGGIFHYFLFVTIFGIFTYALGILLIGPMQKYKVLEMVATLMRSNPEEFVSSKFMETSTGEVIDRTEGDRFHDISNTKVRVNMGSQIRPKSKTNTPVGNAPPPKSFGQVEKDFQDDYLSFLPFYGSKRKGAVREFQEGIQQWGLTAIWDACEIKNAANCVEITHGLPGLRLACYGFQSEPSPKDLAGILNANALYSATTGIVQIAFGCVLVSEHGVSTNVLIPLTISFVSIVLSGFNVFFDFAGKLQKLETEKRMADKIQRTNKKVLADKSEQMKAQRDAKLDNIDKDFQSKTFSNEEDAVLEKNRVKKAANESFAMDLRSINKAASTELQLELTEYRDALAREKAILGGKAVFALQEDQEESAFAVAQRRASQMGRKNAEIERRAEKELDELKTDDPKFAEKARAIVKARDLNLAAVSGLQRMNSNGVQESLDSNDDVPSQDVVIDVADSVQPKAEPEAEPRQMISKCALKQHWKKCSAKTAQDIQTAINAEEGKKLWKARQISKPNRFVFQSLDTVNANQVRRLMTKISVPGDYSGFINGGTHGSKDGSHAGDKQPGQTFGDISFAKQDLRAGDSVGHWGLHIVSEGCPPDYPEANFIVNAWCYSDGKNRVQPGTGLPPMRICSRLASKLCLKVPAKPQDKPVIVNLPGSQASAEDEWNLVDGFLKPNSHPGLCLTAPLLHGAAQNAGKLVLESQRGNDHPQLLCQKWTVDKDGHIISQFDSKFCVTADETAKAIPARRQGRGVGDQDSDNDSSDNGSDVIDSDLEAQVGEAEDRGLSQGGVELKKISKKKLEQCWNLHYC